MNVKTFRRLVLALDGVVEGAHMGHPDFRAPNGRIIASLHPGDKHGMVKLTPEQQERFVSEHPAAFERQNGAWGRQGYTRITLAEIDEETLGEAMTLAWQNEQRRETRQRPTTPRQAKQPRPTRQAKLTRTRR